MTIDFKSYKVLTFDIYGTLIDWESGIYNLLCPLLAKASKTQSDLNDRAAVLHTFTKYERSVQGANPTAKYSEVLTKVFQLMASELDVELKESEAVEFGQSVGSWPAFEDTVAAMQELGKHYKLVVLSNVDKESFSKTLDGALSGVRFDAIYTAEDIGSYKPDLKNFEYLIKNIESDLGIKKQNILHVAQSLYHDHIPAKKIGLAPSVWIARNEGSSVMGGDYENVKDDVELGGKYATLGELAEDVKAVFA